MQCSSEMHKERREISWTAEQLDDARLRVAKYCSARKRSTDKLDAVVNEAVSRWGPALQQDVSASRLGLHSLHDPHVSCAAVPIPVSLMPSSTISGCERFLMDELLSMLIRKPRGFD